MPTLGEVLNSRIWEIKLVYFYQIPQSNNTYWIGMASKKDSRICLTLEVKNFIIQQREKKWQSLKSAKLSTKNIKYGQVNPPFTELLPKKEILATMENGKSEVKNRKRNSYIIQWSSITRDTIERDFFAFFLQFLVRYKKGFRRIEDNFVYSVILLCFTVFGRSTSNYRDVIYVTR